MRILIPIDDSAASEAAVNQVIKQVQARDTEVELLHVLDPFPERLARKKGRQDFPDFAAARKDLRVSAEKLLTRVAERLQSAGFSVRLSIQEGDVRALILEEAKAWPADLIVLGAHPRKGARWFFTASNSEDVSREAPCSVEIVRIPKCTACIPAVDSSEIRRSRSAA
jgi:nucleotide-binding universal stress UspA family protein